MPANNSEFENGKEFSSIIDSNFQKCPGCNRSYVTETSPISKADKKTRVCTTCSSNELTRSVLANIDAGALLDRSNGYDLEDLSDNMYRAKKIEKMQDQAQSDSYFHNQRVRNSNVPIPEATKSGKWTVDYGRNSHTGEIEAYATHPNNPFAHDAILNHETGKVMFEVRDTRRPPETVVKHVRSVLTRHYKKHIEGK